MIGNFSVTGNGEITVCGVHAARGKPECMKLTPHEIRSIAVAAFVDPRSVAKALEGRPLAPLTLGRIRAVLEAQGRGDLVRHLSTLPTVAA